MSKLAQVLQLEPANELVFKGPFNTYVDVNLTLKNPTEEDVYFKVKTTAPKYYCVRPNSGIIGQNESKQVQIVFQPIEPDDQDMDKDKDNSRHKFMIQSAYASSIQTQEEVPEEQMTSEQFWKSVDSTKIMDSKLRVNFIRDDDPVIRPPLSPSVNQEQNAVKGQAWDKPSRVTNKEAATPTSSVDIQAQLQRERDLRKMYQEEKDNLEKENYILQQKNTQLKQNASHFPEIPGLEGIPFAQVALIAVFVLILGLILGKIFF